MKYFVTGTTDEAGSRLTLKLVEAGHEVIAAMRNLRRKGILQPWASWRE